MAIIIYLPASRQAGEWHPNSPNTCGELVESIRNIRMKIGSIRIAASSPDLLSVVGVPTRLFEKQKQKWELQPKLVATVRFHLKNQNKQKCLRPASSGPEGQYRS